MSIIATALKHLVAAGVSGDALLDAIAEMEAAVRAEPKPRSAGAIRTANYRARKAAQASQGVTCDGSDDCDAVVIPSLEVSPQTPLPNPIPVITPLTPHGGPISALDLWIAELVVGVIAAGCEHVIANTLTPDLVLEAWNDLADRRSLPKAKMNDRRRRTLLARIKAYTVEDFTEAIRCVDRNPWMHGDNDKGWRADFDFFLQPKSFTRLIEGSYDRSAQTQ